MKRVDGEIQYEVGDKVRVIDNTEGHEFEIGEIVTIEEIDFESYKCSNEYDYWYLNANEFEAIKESEETK